MRKIFAIAIVTLLGSTAFAAGEVYRWKDAAGIWHYSDQPQPGAQLVSGAKLVPPTPVAAAPASTPGLAPAKNESLPVSAEVAQQVRREAADAKTQQCEKAKVAYDQAVQARRIYKEDAQGNRTFLSEAEIDAARLEKRSVRDLACGT